MEINFPKQYAPNNFFQNFSPKFQIFSTKLNVMVKESCQTVHSCLWKSYSDEFHRKKAMQESLFNNVWHLQAEERLLHSTDIFLWVLPNISERSWNKSEWLLLLNIHFCSIRRPQPQKMFPSTLVILNTFETSTVNSFGRLFLEFLDSQSALTMFRRYVRTVARNRKQSPSCLL